MPNKPIIKQLGCKDFATKNCLPLTPLALITAESVATKEIGVQLSCKMIYSNQNAAKYYPNNFPKWEQLS